MVSCPEHCPLPHVSRHRFVTRYLTGQFKPVRNTKRCPNSPKLLLAYAKADLRHGDVDNLVYRLLPNDMKPLRFPLPSLCMVNINSVSPAFFLKLQPGSENENSPCFPLKDTTVSQQKQPFTLPVFPYFLKSKVESDVNFISPSLSLSKHIYLQRGDVLAAGMGMKEKRLKSVR